MVNWYLNKFILYTFLTVALNLQNCIGAIDGTHFPMTIPPGQQDPYRTTKQGLSQNMMLTCDFDLKFVHVHAGWDGSASDAIVLQDALDHGFSVPPSKFYLVDAGYGNPPQSLVPYLATRYHYKNKEELGKGHNATRSYS